MIPGPPKHLGSKQAIIEVEPPTAMSNSAVRKPET